ncbi:MAG: helix-turn-helix domain-containing protein [Actinomycetota bacterium]
MTFVVRAPRNRLLEPLIDHLWYCEVDGAAGTETLLPTGRSQLVLGLHAEHPLAVVQGPSTRHRVIDAAAQRRAVGVAFRVGALAACTPLDGAELTDELVTVEDIWGGGLRSLADEVQALTTVDDVFTRVEAQVARWAMRHGGSVAPTVVAAAARLGAQRPVAEVADTLDVDRRRLSRQFRSSVGIGLKHYGRLRRFESAVRAVRAPEPLPLGRLAVELGYADQAHLTREFRHFAALTPAELHGDGSPSPTHVVG